MDGVTYRLQKILEIVDRSLLGREILVYITQASSKSREKFWGTASGDKIEVFDTGDPVLSKAINLHEVGHLLLSDNPKLLRNIPDNRTLTAVRMLEDQRMENLMWQIYPRTAKYFTYAIHKLGLVASNRQLLLWGRRFFAPMDIQWTISDEEKRLIDAYLISTSPNERLKIAGEFAQFVAAEGRGQDIDDASKEPMIRGETLEEGNPACQGSTRQSRELSARVKEAIDRVNDDIVSNNDISNMADEADDGEGGEGEGDGEGGGEFADGDESGGGSGCETVEGTGSVGEQDSDNGESVDGGNESGGGCSTNPTSKQKTKPSKSDTIDEMVDELTKACQEELNRELTTSMVGAPVGVEPGCDSTKLSEGGRHPTGSPHIPDAALVEQFYRIMKQTRLSLQSNWKRHQKHGRIDVRAAMASRNVPRVDIFKKFTPDQSFEHRLSVILLLDASSSMCSNDPNRITVRAAAALHAAMRRANGEMYATVFDAGKFDVVSTFASSQFLDYNFYGSTEPEEAIWDGYRALRYVKYRPVFIIFTDAEWSGFGMHSKCFDVLDEISYFVPVYFISVKSPPPRKNMGKVTIYSKVTDLSMFPEILQDILKREEKKVLSELGR